MKYFLIKKQLILICLYWVFPVSLYADDLGRVFTSASDRAQLEKVRNAKPVEKQVEIVEETEEVFEIVEQEEEVVPLHDPILVRGLVYRSDGKNTAWVNDSNTYEGDLESQYIEISSDNIAADEITIVMPDEETKIKIKVGDSYDPKREADN